MDGSILNFWPNTQGRTLSVRWVGTQRGPDSQVPKRSCLPYTKVPKKRGPDKSLPYKGVKPLIKQFLEICSLISNWINNKICNLIINTLHEILWAMGYNVALQNLSIKLSTSRTVVNFVMCESRFLGNHSKHLIKEHLIKHFLFSVSISPSQPALLA